MDIWIYGWIYEYMDIWMDIGIYGWIYGYIDIWMVIWIYGWIYGYMDGHHPYMGSTNPNQACQSIVFPTERQVGVQNEFDEQTY